MTPAPVDVAIVGAGPVGLLAGLLLGQHGLSVAVIERWPTFYPLPRACTIDHEAIRILQDAGLGAAFAPLIDPVIGPDKPYRFLDRNGETLLQIDWNRPGVSGWAQANGFFQPDLERMLVDAIDQLPTVHVTRGQEVVGLEQDGDGVTLWLADTDSGAMTDAVRARHVIGADGARSRIRELVGVAQNDLGFSYDWLVVDVVPHEERRWHPYVVQHCDPARPHTLVNSGPGRRRWEFMRLPGETIEELNTTETAWRLLAPSGITRDNATLERHAVYTFRGAWADEWQRGRVFLAGDAAHLMPPFLGQGLCSGMRDAVALAWRLAAVSTGVATDALLASYGPERTAHVQEIIGQAVEMGRIICMIDPAEVAARDTAMKAAIRDPALALKPPPEPRLGDAGGYRAGDPGAGYLCVQGRVERGGRTGLFDDVVGAGWQLLLRDAAHLSDATRATIDRLGIRLAVFGVGGDTVDVDGSYAAFFARLGADAVLARPDLYTFGSASADGVEALVASAAVLMETGHTG